MKMSQCLTKSDSENKVLRRVGIFEITLFQNVGIFASSIFLTSNAENRTKYTYLVEVTATTFTAT
jgi:hypothetical protein